MLLFSNKIEYNSLEVNFSIDKHLLDLITWWSRVNRWLLRLLSCFTLFFHLLEITSFHWVKSRYIFVKLNLAFKFSQSFKEPKASLEIQDVPTFHRSVGKQKYWITYVTNLYIISTLKYLNFGRMFTKVVKCKHDIMPFNVFWSVLWKEAVI